MKLEKVHGVGPLLKEAEESVGHFCRVERRCSKCEHEYEDAKGEDVSGLWSTGQIICIMHLWCHVDFCTHFLIDHVNLGHTKAKIT
jgi:hypothetical protein